MRLPVLLCLGLLSLAPLASFASPANVLPLPDEDVAALAREVNGEMAKQTLEGIVQQHRERGSRGFRTSAELGGRVARERSGCARSRSCSFPPTARSSTARSARARPGMPSAANCPKSRDGKRDADRQLRRDARWRSRRTANRRT